MIFNFKTISEHHPKGPLLDRYYLFMTPWFGITLHHLLRSDDDRALHDHPWWFVSILLSSGYYEYRYIDKDEDYHRQLAPHWFLRGALKRWKPRFSILFRKATDTHRLELVKPCWTLVIRGRTKRDWGFYTDKGWVRHDKF